MKTIRLFISSPGDVAEKRDKARPASYGCAFGFIVGTGGSGKSSLVHLRAGLAPIPL